MPLQSLDACPLCGNRKFFPYLTCVDHTTTEETFSLVTCSSCNFTITNPSPDAHSIGRYYQSTKYISHTGGGQSIVDRIYISVRKLALRWKRQLILKHSRGNTLLDIGCGTGDFLLEMKQHGYSISGVEPSDAARELAINKTQSSISENIGGVREKFQVITLWHVLEHLHNLTSTFQKITSLLADSGTIFIAVPNLASADATDYKSNWAGYDVPRHLWHFKQSDMKKLVEQHGFKIVKTIPMQLDAYYVSLLSEGYVRPNQSKAITMLRALWSGFKSNFKAHTSGEYSSLIYIAKR